MRVLDQKAGGDRAGKRGAGWGRRSGLGILPKTGLGQQLTNDFRQLLLLSGPPFPHWCPLTLFSMALMRVGREGAGDTPAQPCGLPSFVPAFFLKGPVPPCPGKGVKARAWISGSHCDQTLLHVPHPQQCSGRAVLCLQPECRGPQLQAEHQ